MSSAAEYATLPAQTGIVRFFRALVRDPFSSLALFLVVLFLLLALFAPVLSPYDPLKIDVAHKLEGPSLAHWFGTDHLGRDLLSRIVYGSRTALTIAVTSVLLAGAFGLMLGLIAGYGPRWLDGSLVLVFDSMNALPMIMFALAVITVIGPGIGTLILVIVLTSFPSYARLIRAQTLSLANSEYVMAERSLGASPLRIILIHLLPNVAGPLVILVEAGLSFIGLGVRPPTPSWGSILYDSYTSLRSQPSMVIFGGLPLVLSTLGFTFFGEGLRDVLDPRLKLGRRA